MFSRDDTRSIHKSFFDFVTTILSRSISFYAGNTRFFPSPDYISIYENKPLLAQHSFWKGDVDLCETLQCSSLRGQNGLIPMKYWYTEGGILIWISFLRIPNDTGRDQILTSLLKRNKFSTEILLLLLRHTNVGGSCWGSWCRWLSKRKRKIYVKGDRYLRSRVIGWKDTRWPRNAAIRVEDVNIEELHFHPSCFVPVTKGARRFKPGMKNRRSPLTVHNASKRWTIFPATRHR